MATKINYLLIFCLVLAFPLSNSFAEDEILEHGVFEIPEGSEEPGPIEPGMMYTFDFSLEEGQLLTFGSMLIESNDWFLTSTVGIDVHALFNEEEKAEIDITEMVQILDAGTEFNEEFGEGAHQGARQTEANSGEVDTDTTVRDVTCMLPQSIKEMVSIVITRSEKDASSFTLTINVLDEAVSALSPGVWLSFTGLNPLFVVGEVAADNGLEALAEDGDTAGLIEWLEGM